MYEEQAQRVLEMAPGSIPEIARAKEIAQHLRWRASKVNPRDFGDKVEVHQKVDITSVSDDELVSTLAKYGIQVPALGAPAGSPMTVAMPAAQGVH